MVIGNQNLYFAAGLLAALKASMNDSRIVYHQDVTRLEKFSNFIKAVMGHISGLPIQTQQIRTVPLSNRLLGNQIYGQMVVVIVQ
jgi:hypothetical protein